MTTPLAIIFQEVWLSWRYLRRHTRRSSVALATIVCGIAAYLLAGGFIHWVLEKTRDAAIYSQLGHIQVTRPGYFTTGIADPYRHLLPESVEPIKASIEASQVESIAPRLIFTGLLSKEESTISFMGEGIDPQAEEPIALAIHVVEGKDLTESGPDSVLIGKGLAANAEVKPGDKVVLLANTADGALNAVEVTVAGLFVSISKAYDDATIRAPIAISRKLVRVAGSTSWVVLLRDTNATPQVVKNLEQALPTASFEITPWWDLADFYKKTVELLTKQIGVVRLLIGLIVVLSISNTMSMTVIERTREIGTSMALGATRTSILRLFIIQGLLLGLVGGTLGVITGTALASLISYIGIPMPPAPGMSEGYIGEIWVSPDLALGGLLLGVITTLIASAAPAWKASRMNIVDALRHYH